MAKVGRPTKYCPKLAAKICTSIALNDLPLDELCKLNPDFATPQNIWLWRMKYPEFREAYEAAKKEQLKLSLEEMKKIPDKIKAEHTYLDALGNSRIDPAAVALGKLIADNTKWFAVKLLPKEYGDKLETTHKIDKVEDWLDTVKEGSK